MKTLLLLATAALYSGLAFGQVLYQVDFNNQGANRLVQTGAPPQFVSQVNFGSPQVLTSLGGLRDQPLCLDMVGNEPAFYYDQVQLNLPLRFQTPRLDISFDFTSVGLLGSQALFALTVDTSTGVHNLTFRNNGNIELYDAPSFVFTNIGAFSAGETFRIRLQMDTTQHQWSVFKDTSLLGTSVFTPGSYFQDIRFSYGLYLSSSTPDKSAVGIDNIEISVPEPTSTALWILGLALPLGWRRLRRARLRYL